MKDETIINILSDIANFNLSIFGISITVFTVLYAFLLSKKDFVRETNELIKHGKAPYYFFDRVSFSFAYMRKWKRLNSHLAVIAAVSFLLYIVNIVAKYIYRNQTFAILDISVTILLANYLFVMLVKTFKNYLRETSVN